MSNYIRIKLYTRIQSTIPRNDFYTCQGDIMNEFQLDALILA